MNIKYSGNKGRKGFSFPSINRRKLSIYYLGSRNYITSHKLKLKLIEEGVKKHQCERCLLTEWMGDIVPIELHHIDGNRNNNKLDNLQILCPNCHSKTSNHSGRGIKRKIKNKCVCGSIISKRSKGCRSCVKKKQKRKIKNRPTYEQLMLELSESNYSAVGKKYGVSDNSIRKWIKSYESWKLKKMLGIILLVLWILNQM
jgi:Zn finger protein HypA/HybF involved in hydrogenase expression